MPSVGQNFRLGKSAACPPKLRLQRPPTGLHFLDFLPYREPEWSAMNSFLSSSSFRLKVQRGRNEVLEDKN